MDPERESDEGGLFETGEEYVEAVADTIPDVEPVAIGSAARELDVELTSRERMRLPRATVYRLGALVVVYLLGLLLMGTYFGGESGVALPIVPWIVLAAVLLELLDSAGGMGFGTTLAPLLFILGYEPLQVTPVLLISETLTGVVSGGLHHEFDNVSFSVRPPNDATKLALLFAGIGGIASVASIVVTYFLFTFPAAYIELYVVLLVLGMGILGLVRARLAVTVTPNRRRLVGFAVLAGINKGVGGGGYGPVITLGQILSGVYEKSATAIASLAESVVSFVGVATFVGLYTQGVAVDLTLLPSIYTGGFVAAIGAPYLVRIVPNRVWRYLIPLYASGIGVLGLTIGLDV